MSENDKTSNILLLNTQSVKATIRYLKNKRIYLIIAAVIGMSLGIFYCSIKSPLYSGTVTFSLEGDDNSSGAGLLGLAAQFGLDIGGGVGGIFQGDNILELFKSRKMIEETLMLPYNNGTITFADAFLDITGKRGDLQKVLFPVNAKPPFTRVQDSVMGEMYTYITKGLLDVQKPDQRLNIFSINFKSHDEIFTKSFVEKLVAEVSNFYVTTKTKRAKYNVEILQSRTDSIRRAFDRALYGRAAAIDANLNPAFQTPSVPAEKKQADVTVLGTAYGELLKNLELAKFTLLKEVPYIQIIDEPHFPLEKKEYPFYIYVPLAVIGLTIFCASVLIGLKIVRRIYRTFFTGLG